MTTQIIVIYREKNNEKRIEKSKIKENQQVLCAFDA